MSEGSTINQRTDRILRTLFILVSTLVGVVILNGFAPSVSGNTLFNTTSTCTVLQSCRKLNEAIHSSVMQRLSQINLLSGKNETVGTSRFEASWASMMDTLEKIRNMMDDLRRLVETLHQMTQTLIAVINELSHWMDQVSIDPSLLSSV